MFFFVTFETRGEMRRPQAGHGDPSPHAPAGSAAQLDPAPAEADHQAFSDSDGDSLAEDSPHSPHSPHFADCADSPTEGASRTSALLRSAAQLRVKADSSGGPIYALVRWPIVVGLVLVIAVQAVVYIGVRMIVYLWELTSRSSYKPVADASSYVQWKVAAVEMDTTQVLRRVDKGRCAEG